MPVDALTVECAKQFLHDQYRHLRVLTGTQASPELTRCWQTVSYRVRWGRSSAASNEPFGISWCTILRRSLPTSGKARSGRRLRILVLSTCRADAEIPRQRI